MSYQERDREVVDYETYTLPGSALGLRGPPPPSLEAGAYFTCLGAAQTFGCFCPRPYPALLAEQLGLPVLNLGQGGAGPGFFLRPEILRYVNQARFAVVQVMSGRSESNSLFDAGGHEYLTRRRDGLRIGAEAAWRELLEEDLTWCRWPLGRRVLNQILARVGRRRVRRLVAETRTNFLRSYEKLLQAIEVPTLLLWFSKRTPAYHERYTKIWSLFGEFPQLVDAEMVGVLRDLADDYVECVSERGSPQPLVSRFTGEPTTVDSGAGRSDLGQGRPWTHNAYYPSPEMHADAAGALESVCRRYQSALG